MSLVESRESISKKAAALKASGFQTGNAKGAVRDLNHGGFLQEFTNCNIYWHPNTGAHEVHGEILKAYLSLGGPDFNPQTGERNFGFPKTDEERTPFQDPVSKFEFGAIYFVRGFGAVPVWGKIFADAFAELDPGETKVNMLPISPPIRTSTGEVVFTQRGCHYRQKDHPVLLSGDWQTPLLGNPAIVQAVPNQALPIKATFTIASLNWNVFQKVTKNNGGQVLEQIFKNRLALRDVRTKKQILPLESFIEKTTTATTLKPPTFASVVVGFRLAGGSTPTNRTLYDICLRLPDGKLALIAPHAVYACTKWEGFGFLHATDLHASQRIEFFRRKLKQAGREFSNQELSNPNDNIRLLINLANRLHRDGKINFIVATGDLVDYQFEDFHDRRGGGNFQFFERLLLGQEKSSDAESPPSEELQVPIFTVLGNHDYVVNAYQLYFTIDIPFHKDETLEKFWDFNLNKSDAKALQGGKILKVSTDEASTMAISTSEVHPYYRERINPQSSYTVQFGNDHQIAMLDTGPNKDIIDGTWDAFQEYFGFSNENESTFVRGTPNSRGISKSLDLVRRAIARSTSKGILVIGMHAPPLNNWGNEYPYYFHENIRGKLSPDRRRALVESYLSRHSNVLTGQSAGHDSYPRSATTHFKEGTIEDLLDFGIARDGAPEFLELCAGNGNPIVDLVLCGHVHTKVEHRLRHDAQKGLLFFSDFYTENPNAHRAAYDFRIVLKPAGQNLVPVMEGDTRRIHIVVQSGADPNAQPREVRDHTSNFADFRRLAIPPNPNTLQDAANKQAWWKTHRPLILQTSCLGPIDFNQRDKRADDEKNIKPHVPLQGLRLLTVVDNSLARIHYLGIEEIKKEIAAPGKRRSRGGFGGNTGGGVVSNEDQKAK